MSDRIVIVNADDLGRSRAINRGVIEACERDQREPHGVLAVRRRGREFDGARPRPAHRPRGRVHRDGRREAVYTRVDLADVARVEAECREQLDEFRRLTRREPTHLDSHQDVHYGRMRTGEHLPEAISSRALVETLQALPIGVTEVACHPGYADENGVYAREREDELRALCDAEVASQSPADGIRLSSFADVARRL